LTNRITLGDAIEQGDVRLTGDAHRIRHIMQCFDLTSMEIT